MSCEYLKVMSCQYLRVMTCQYLKVPSQFFYFTCLIASFHEKSQPEYYNMLSFDEDIAQTIKFILTGSSKNLAEKGQKWSGSLYYNQEFLYYNQALIFMGNW